MELVAARSVPARLVAAAQGIERAEQGRFALWLPVAAIAGAAAYFGLRAEPPLWAGAALIALGAALSIIRNLRLIRAAGLCLAYFGFGLAAAQLATWRQPPFPALPSHAATITGRVTANDALPIGERLTLAQVSLDGHPIGPRRLRLHSTEAAPEATIGASIAVRARVSPPPPPAYPGGRDLQRDDWFSGLAGYGFTLGKPAVTTTAPPARLGLLRDRIANRIRAQLPGPRGAIAATLLTGLSDAIPEPDRAAFRDAGLSHLLAIAGLHIGIVMGIVLLATRFVLLRSERIALFWPVRQIAALASLAAGFAYLELTGQHVPTLRSFIAAALAVLALLVGRRAISLRGWGLAVLVVISLAPEQVTGPSFQLSFAAVLALIAGYEVLRAPLSRLRGEGKAGRRALHHAATLILTSLLAGIASIPFIAYHFGHIQAYFVLANLIAVPLTAAWIMPWGLVALMLMPLGLSLLALTPMGWGIGVVLSLAHHVAAWPGATIAVPHLPHAAMLLLAFALAWLCLWRGQLRLLAALPALAACLIAAIAVPPDLLIAPDARVVGLATRAGLYLHTARGGDDYVASTWQNWLGHTPQPLTAAPGASCDATGCRLPNPGAFRLGSADSPCDAKVMVAQAGALPYCAGSIEIDRSFVWRNGAIAVWFGPPARLLTDRTDRGRRPWVFLPPEQRRASLTEPLAPTE
jgi:competence protein ComEC